jgi:hypothetical protein
MAINELIFVVLLVAGMIGSGILLWIKTKNRYLLYTYLTFFACFGFWEWRSCATTGESISQAVGRLGDEPFWFWAFILANVISWGALMWHFIGMRKKKE